LSVVIPAYNEQDLIEEVLLEWVDVLSQLGVRWEIRVYDDGSRDRTATILEGVARRVPGVVPVRQSNRGHGPTILRGYAEARGEWVLQVDSDGEIPAIHLVELWRNREADLVLGVRVGRQAPIGRRIITGVSAAAVRLLFGRGIRDVNTPYRLYRRSSLKRLLLGLPPDLFAPNVVLSGRAVRAGMHVVQVPVPHRGRRAGTGHLGSLRAWKAAVRSLLQTWRVSRQPG
jgi:glycosyltransferase involved in cell wall biosynthesis